MRALVQRVQTAHVTVDGERVGQIGPGLLVLLGVHHTDTPAEADWLAQKVATLRIFSDDEGRMNRSVLDTGGDVLVVSQFTLYGSLTKGTRPSFSAAAPPEHAQQLYLYYIEQVAAHLGKPVATGRFGAMMQVSLVNDGPVTLLLERAHG